MDEEPSIRRRLAAILAADIAGYSRLMHEDEPATVRDLKAHQSVILPLIGRHGGRIIDTAGDGIMAEFPSVIGATECAVEIQTVMAERNEGVPESRRMRFRIGINLGDVIHDDTRIYGDGINIAARLEALAPPGAVLVSNTVYDQVRGKLPFTFEDVGERQVKNIEQPVRMYQLHIPGGSSKAVATRVRRPAPTDRWRWIVWGLAAFLVLLGAGRTW
jgi:class 3 adenylate cyclase